MMAYVENFKFEINIKTETDGITDQKSVHELQI